MADEDIERLFDLQSPEDRMIEVSGHSLTILPDSGHSSPQGPRWTHKVIITTVTTARVSAGMSMTRARHSVIWFCRSYVTPAKSDQTARNPHLLDEMRQDNHPSSVLLHFSQSIVERLYYLHIDRSYFRNP